MASITFRGVTKRFGSSTVIPSLDLEIRDREFIVFVGPSGCGKSTLLRIIAGLEPVDGGDVCIGDRRVNDVPPAQRDIAMVFQDYALYPHMTAFDNMAFGLEMRNMPRAEIERRVHQAADMLHIRDYLGHKPKAMSGGQRQRVAMGRAMVRNPQVFLFDEPLSNLDAKLRADVRTEIKTLSQQLRTTMVFVTHDQVEAMTMADRIVILKSGVVQQIGTPQEVYGRPANRFVAGFIGSPAMNFLPARLESGVVRLPGGTLLEPDGGQGAALGSRRAGTVVVGVRPEHLRFAAAGEPGIDASVSVIEPLGADTLVHVEIEGARHVARVAPELAPAVGDAVKVRLDPRRVHFFDDASGEALC